VYAQVDRHHKTTRTPERSQRTHRRHMSACVQVPPVESVGGADVPVHEQLVNDLTVTAADALNLAAIRREYRYMAVCVCVLLQRVTCCCCCCRVLQPSPCASSRTSLTTTRRSTRRAGRNCRGTRPINRRRHLCTGFPRGSHAYTKWPMRVCPRLPPATSSRR